MKMNKGRERTRRWMGEGIFMGLQCNDEEDEVKRKGGKNYHGCGW